MRKLILTILLLLMAAMPAAHAQEPFTSLETVITTLPVTDAQIELAQTIYDGVASCQTTIRFPKTTLKEDVVWAMRIIFYDYPELFHYSGEYLSYRVDGDATYCGRIDPVYTMTAEEYAAKRDALYAKVDEILAKDSSPKALHDYVIAHVAYGEGSEEYANAYGALIDGQAHCSGYTDALTLLYRRAGIPCGLVRGTVRYSDGHTADHDWNAVIFDDVCYIDATWDDVKKSKDQHRYYGLTASQMGKNHFADYPECLPEGTAVGKQ